MSSRRNDSERPAQDPVQGAETDRRPIGRWAEFVDAGFELSYRDSTLARDRSLTLFAMIVSAVVSAAFVIADYSMFGSAPDFWRLLTMRGSLVAFTAIAAIGIRFGSSARYDGWTTAWAVAVLLVIVGIDQSRASDYLAHFAFDSVILLAIFVVLVTRYRLQLILGLSYATALILLAMGKNVDATAQWAVITSIVAVNLFGMLMSWRLHSLGRSQFATMHAEHKLRVSLEKLAFTDALTNISNRRDFINRSEAEFERFRRHRRTFSLLMLDLDHFKKINDRFGHDAGDDVLRQFGEMLAHEARTSDLPARMGGEEFAVLLPETAIDEAEDVASRILESTRALKTAASDGSTVTVSIGLTQVRLFDESIDDVLSRADRALYQAKAQGRDRAVSAPA